ncbi:MAG: magnesium transporter [Longimicrobiales bacterium]
MEPHRTAPVVTPDTEGDVSPGTTSGPHAAGAADRAYRPGTVGTLMEAPVAVLPPDATVAATIEELRRIVPQHFVTYVYVTAPERRLEGVVAMRELLLAPAEHTLADIMIRDPFVLRPDMDLLDAMRAAVGRHYPVYPVCDDAGRLVGLIRGHAMFERQAIEISAQPGQMVGVEKDENMATPLLRCWRLRYPWLQFNLITALLAAAVIALFQSTLDQLVILATFLPVLAGQSGNTGAQALAVTLRGLTLGEIGPGTDRVRKEALLGLGNGAIVGVTAGLVMYVYASLAGEVAPLALAGVVFGAMLLSCVLSGMIGALVPLALRRVGADPATASSIFLTTVTDVASMGLLLGLAAWLVL